MKKISSNEIKNNFLDFFKKNNHYEIKNSSILPSNDPTLLFINSGMAAIKNYFTGEEVPPCPNLCNVQYCIRTIDIDEVGDMHHLTSFSMLGNWSINGSYFKHGSIKLAFEFITKCLKISKNKLYVSVFSGDKKLNLEFDEESKKYWMEVGIDESRIVPCGIEDNFWGPTSNTGPCGPCTEIFYDTEVGKEYIQGGIFDTKRYIEIWNAGVFMMFNKNEDSTFDLLPFSSVDAGAGLERFAMVLQNVESVYETDLLSPIKNYIEFLFNTFFDFNKINYIKDENFVRSVRILTDHLRTICLILSAKIKPSNEGRGYIPRKLIRKCLIIVKQLVDKNIVKNSKKYPKLLNVVKFILEKFNKENNDFLVNKKFIIDEFENEVQKFEYVLYEGIKKLENIKNNLKDFNLENLAFDMVTTHGLPIDVIKDYANQNSILFDENEFNLKLKEHKEISKSKTLCNIVKDEILDKILKKNIDIYTEFLGYDKFKCKSNVLKIFSKDGEELNEINVKNDISYILFNKSVIYAKSGGQESDFAKIYNDNFDARIIDSFKKKINKNEIYIYVCKINYGFLKINDNVNLIVDLERRFKISKAHSSAHLLQSTLKKIFGNDIHQSGSKIEEEKLRFDFNYDNKILHENILEIEKIVNEKINKNLICIIKNLKKSDAISQGATAIFNDKYGDYVRVVNFEDFSKELCGGTHVNYTSQIGSFVISGCENIGKGIKRINALVGGLSFEYLQNKSNILYNACEIINSNSEKFLFDLEKIKKKSELSKKNNEIIKESDFIKVKEGFYYLECEEFPSKQNLLKICNNLKALIVLISKNNDKIKKIMILNYNGLKIDASDILKNKLKKFGSKGGGNKISASGKLDNFSVKEIINEILKIL